MYLFFFEWDIKENMLGKKKKIQKKTNKTRTQQKRMQERPTKMLWAFAINQTQEGRVAAEGGEFGNGAGARFKHFLLLYIRFIS
jgi:hypothetical protein